MHLFQENTPKDLKSALETLAILDIGPFLDGQYSALDRLALEIRYACETIGFFYIKNHGIANPVIEEAFAQSRRFHDLPLSKKQNLPLDKHNVGYLPMNKSVQKHSTVHKATKPNQNESFFITHDRGRDHPDVIAGTPLRGGNYWPEELPGFRNGVMTYFRALNNLGQRLVPAFAVALGMPANYLEEAFANENNAKLRLLHYPPTQIENNDFGAGPHTDNSFMTILARDDTPGLAIRLPSGEWLSPPVIPGTFLVNIGNMMRRISNDRFLSTPHGVVVEGDTDRYSMAYFHSPNVTQLIKVAPSCIEKNQSPKYEPARYADLIQEFYQANYFHQDGYGKTAIKNRYE